MYPYMNNPLDNCQVERRIKQKSYEKKKKRNSKGCFFFAKRQHVLI